MYKLVYNLKKEMKDVESFLHYFQKGKKKIPCNDIAIVLFLFYLFRLKFGYVAHSKKSETLSELHIRPPKNIYFEDQKMVVKYVSELAKKNCLSIDKKIIKKIHDLETDYLIVNNFIE